jgi:hypothetical protein
MQIGAYPTDSENAQGIRIGFEPPLDGELRGALRQESEFHDIPDEALTFWNRGPYIGTPFTEVDCEAIRLAAAEKGLVFQPLIFATAAKDSLKRRGFIVNLDKNIRTIDERHTLFDGISLLSS